MAAPARHVGAPLVPAEFELLFASSGSNADSNSVSMHTGFRVCVWFSAKKEREHQREDRKHDNELASEDAEACPSERLSEEEGEGGSSMVERADSGNHFAKKKTRKRVADSDADDSEILSEFRFVLHVSVLAMIGMDLYFLPMRFVSVYRA